MFSDKTRIRRRAEKSLDKLHAHFLRRVNKTKSQKNTNGVQFFNHHDYLMIYKYIITSNQNIYQIS